MHPWQQRVLATAICAEVERTFAAHGLATPPLAGWWQNLQASTSASAAQASAASALALGLHDQATLNGLVYGGPSKGSQAAGRQGIGITAGAGHTNPAQHDPLQVPTPEQYEGHRPSGGTVPGSTDPGQGGTRWPNSHTPDAAHRSALSSGADHSFPQTGQPPAIPGRAGWLWQGGIHGDAWLVRVVSLLEACCAWPEVIALLSHLLQSHIQHSVSSAGVQLPPQPGLPAGLPQQDGACMSAAAVIGIQEPTVMGLLTCISDR
jgi:hypothetical protein